MGLHSARVLLAAVGALAGLGVFTAARADGEAGLVIQDGDSVRTFCIAFQGDGISGDALLRAAGEEFDAYGGGSGLALCSIGERGCHDAGSFSSCFCQCQGGGCTYWAFFTRDYGKSWVYSSLAFNLLRAGDGDLHGWKWGQGSLNSAPAPRDITFEQVCGHPPGPSQPAPPTTAPPPPPPSPPPVSSVPLTTLATSSAAPSASPSAPAEALATLTATRIPASGTPPSGHTPAPPEAGPRAGDGSSNASSLVVFGVVALVLAGAIVAGLVWRSRHAA